MELTIDKEKETPLLSRRRVSATMVFDSETPARVKVRDALAKKLKEEASLVVIRHIYQRFGSRTAKIIAHVYQNADLLKKFEHENLVAKNEGRKVEKKGAEPAKAA